MFKCSHAVLSMIFGILGKFCIGIGNQKNSIGFFFVDEKSKQKKMSKIILVENFLGRKFFDRKKKVGRTFFGRKKSSKNQSFFDDFFSTKKFSTNFFFSIKKISTQKIFFAQKLCSTIFCLDFPSTKKNPIEIFWLPIPMRNFPKIPKIILRTACEHLSKR